MGEVKSLTHIYWVPQFWEQASSRAASAIRAMSGSSILEAAAEVAGLASEIRLSSGGGAGRVSQEAVWIIGSIVTSSSLVRSREFLAVGFAIYARPNQDTSFSISHFIVFGGHGWCVVAARSE
jgi:hypothetical protein